MLPLVKTKKIINLPPFIRILSYLLMVFSLLFCFLVYILLMVNLGDTPTMSVPSENALPPVSSSPASPQPPQSGPGEIPPPVQEAYYGETVLPNSDLAAKIRTASKANTDTVGWLTVPGTAIDYPVMQYIDNAYYLRRNYIDRRYKFAGSIFADYRDVGTNRNDLSRNYVIYGHNLTMSDDKLDGEMFAELLRFRDYDFARQSQYIYYSTLQDTMIWQVFAVFYTDTNYYYINVSPGSDAEFMDLVNEAKQRSEFIYDADITAGDKILTLSTCTYRYNTKAEQRFVVMARLVPDNTAEAKEVLINPRPKPPNFDEN
ncbi:MAG: class B sortase [Oscillospiraceae bacterium]|jgi:sortase B|nr:class B sortase [Oscillospiraceae bacterium]